MSENTLPTLNLSELEWAEKLLGRKLTNDEAQELIHKATLEAASEFWSCPERTDPSR
jgi:hypothetical protein